MKTIKSDSKFLAQHGLMDYSLLFIREHKQLKRRNSSKAFTINRESENSINKLSFTRNKINNKRCNFHFGIIDYLQKWDLNKMTESKLKVWFKGADPKRISAVPPAFYQSRFMDIISEYVLNIQDRAMQQTFLEQLMLVTVYE